jgi:SAM-dependent methyltransferase
MGLGSALSFVVSLLDPQVRQHATRAARTYRQQVNRECPICGYVGPFDAVGHPMRFGAGCVRCKSMERHRLVKLALDRGLIAFAGADILHFAPEATISNIIRQAGPRSYVTADIQPGLADRVLNIEAMDVADASFDVIICSHVLEHVNDDKALAEMKRAVRPDGKIIILIPIVEGWDSSYEDSSITSEPERDRHFGQPDHVRFYGADFRDRVRRHGLVLTEFTADGPDSARYGLIRGEKVFIAAKPA